MSQTFEEKVEALASELGEKIAALAKNDKEMTDGLAIAAIALIDSALELDEVFEELGDEDDEFGWEEDEWDEDEIEWDESLDSFDPFSHVAGEDDLDDHGP